MKKWAALLTLFFSTGTISGFAQEVIEPVTEYNCVGPTAFSADGNTLHIICKNEIIKWNLDKNTGIALKAGAFPDNEYPSSDILFAPDKQRFIMLTGSKEVLLFNLEYKTMAKFGKAEQVCFSPDGKLVLTLGLDKSLSLHDINGIELNKHLINGGNPIQSMGFFPDSKRIIVASNNIIHTFDLQFQAVSQFRSEQARYLPEFADDSSGFLINFYDRIELYNSQDLKPIVFMPNNGSAFKSACFSPVGTKILTATREGIVQLWDLSGKKLTEFEEQPAGFSFLDEQNKSPATFSPSGETVLTHSGGDIVSVWDIKGALVFRAEEKCTFAAYLSGGKQLLLCPKGKKAYVTDIKGNLLYWLPNELTNPKISPDGNWILTSNGELYKNPYYSGTNKAAAAESVTKLDKPANLSFSEITTTGLGKNQILDGGERIIIQAKITNNGPGIAYNLRPYLKADGLIENVSITAIPKLAANESTEVSFEFKVPESVMEGITKLELQCREGNGFDADRAIIEVHTAPFVKPEPVLADFQFISEGGTALLGKPVTLRMLVQNKSKSEAKAVKVSCSFPPDVFASNATEYNLGDLGDGETKQVDFEFFANKRYSALEIPVEVLVSEAEGRFGSNRKLSIAVNSSTAKPRTIQIEAQTTRSNGISNASLVSVVDKDIPQIGAPNDNRYALVIGNEDYSSKQQGLNKEVDVKFAANDAQVFAQYAKNLLQVPTSQVTVLLNATGAEINRAVRKLNLIMKESNGKGEVIFFYAGHGFPDEKSREAMIVPVDVAADNITDAIKVSSIVDKFAEFPTRRVTLFLDACFSGATRGGEALIVNRGIKVVPVNGGIRGNMVLFGSCSGTQPSQTCDTEQHGYFTFCLLKTLKQANEKLTYGQLTESLTSEVPLMVAKQKGLEQKPVTIPAPELKDTWQIWQLFE